MAFATWLSTVLEVLILVAVIFYACLTGFLLLECLLAITPRQSQEVLRDTKVPTFSILMPAHNEASGIQKTLMGLISEVNNPQQILVVADNCEDQTAQIAKATGVSVLERSDASKRGKGYALDFGLKALAGDPPEVVVMVDADCSVTPGTILRIAQESFQSRQPIQAVYLMEQPPEPTLRDRISAFALTVKNRVRAAGLTRLGAPIMLGGTGMAFPWQALTAVELASGHIVEDMKLGIDLAIAGYQPKLSLGNQVIGLLPSDESAAKSQRTRWEHGHLEVLRTYVPNLLWQSLRQLRLDLFLLALDLAIPPLALWSILGIALTLVTGMFAIFHVFMLPFQVQLAADLLLFGIILLCWFVWGRKVLEFSQLLAIPLYILWKIPIYLKAIVSPEKSWVRTKRDT